MEGIQSSLKETLNDIEFNGTKLQYDEKTGKYRRIILDDDIDVSINYRKKPISNTVIIDPIQQIIYDLGTKEKIIDFFKKEKQNAIFC